MYNWIQTTFQVGDNLAQGLALIISLAVVLVLFGLFIFIIKRLMGARAPQSRGRQPRIALMDSAAIDSRRRLMLVRRDNVEHLILVGGPSDVVVEQNIIRNTPLTAGQSRSAAYPAQQQAANVKAPLAPGPDIPLTPEDTAAAVAAPPPQAPETRQSAPTAVTPTPQQVSSAPAVLQPAQPQTKTPEPYVSKTSALLSNARSSLGATRSSASKSTVAAPESPAPAPTPSRSLAEKAASNPFLNKTAAAKSQQPTAEKTEPQAVRPPEKTEAEPKPQSSNPLRSLTRPFSPKDRPSYGSGKISPPASGPAARAKTVLGTPSETAARVEPAIGEPPKPDTAGDQNSATPDSREEVLEKATDQASNTSEQAGNNSPEPVAAEASDTGAEIEETGDNGSTDTASKAPSDNKSDAQPSEEKPAVPVAAEPVSDQTDSQDKVDPEKSPEEATAGDDQTSAGSDTKDNAPSENGLGDRNPIEAEMAKILDELGGQPKQ